MCNLEDFNKYKESKENGLYALFLKDGCSLSPFFKDEWCKKIYAQMDKFNCPNLLYIGKAEGKSDKLSDRTQNHLFGYIRFDTVKYSISYCAGLQLYGSKGYKISKKRFIKIEDEDKIAKWLYENTYFKIMEKENCKTLEKEYLKKYCPALNIKDNPHKIIPCRERGRNYIEIPDAEFEDYYKEVDKHSKELKKMSASDIEKYFNIN